MSPVSNCENEFVIIWVVKFRCFLFAILFTILFRACCYWMLIFCGIVQLMDNSLLEQSPHYNQHMYLNHSHQTIYCTNKSRRKSTLLQLEFKQYMISMINSCTINLYSFSELRRPVIVRRVFCLRKKNIQSLQSCVYFAIDPYTGQWFDGEQLLFCYQVRKRAKESEREKHTSMWKSHYIIVCNSCF